MEYSSQELIVDKDIEIENSFNNYVSFFSLKESDLQKSILDVGASNGNFINYLRNVIGNKNAYGVEKEERGIDSNTDGIFVADGLSLPFDDKTFELVTAKHYLPIFLKLSEETNKKALDELIRVLKPGGVLLADIFTPIEMEKFRSPDKDVYSAESPEELDNWYSTRIDKSKYVMDYLNELKAKGYMISISVNEKGDTILKIINQNE